MNENVDNEVLQDGELLEKSFNDAMDDLHVTLKGDEETGQEELFKAKSEVVDKDEEKPEEEEEKKGDSEEEEEDDEVEKSMEDILREDPEAAAAMDVEPFLLQLVKAMDESNSMLRSDVAETRKLTKSIGQAMYQSAQLQKSTSDMIKAIGGQPIPAKGVQTLGQPRFAPTGTPEVDKPTMLAKSTEWLKQRKIDLKDAGNIESRVNKNELYKRGDPLDIKVKALMDMEEKV